MNDIVPHIGKSRGIHASASISVTPDGIVASSSVWAEATKATTAVNASSNAYVGANFDGESNAGDGLGHQAGVTSNRPDDGSSKKKKLWYHFAEGWVNPGSASALFLTLALAMLAGILVYFAYGQPRDAVEYASYVFPCCAAIAAGLTAYREDLKGLFFLVSACLLMMGVAAFLAIHSEKILVRTWTATALVVAANLIVFVMAGRALAVAHSKWREGVLQLLLIVPLVSITCYAGSFVYHNAACLKEHSAPGECTTVWRFWTFWTTS